MTQCSWNWFLAASLVVAHFAVLAVHVAPAISTPDAHAYYAQAKWIANTGRTFFVPESPCQYVGPHWRLTRANRYYATHPPGLAAILAPIYRWMGPEATLWVCPLMASASLFALYLICRNWIGPWWGLLALALMAVNPMANEHALFGDSHTASCFFLIWGLCFLRRWPEAQTPWLAFAAALFLGVIPTIRYAEALLLPGVLIYVLLHMKRKKTFWLSVIVGMVGVAIPLAVLCARNHDAYGAFWRTGYALTNEQAAFGLEYFVPYSPEYLWRILTEGCGPIFPFAAIGLGVLCARRDTRRWGLLFVMLSLPITLLYMSYYWPPDPQSMRFLLPTFFVYVIAAVWLLRLLAGYRPRVARGASVILLVLTCGWGAPLSLLAMHHLHANNSVLAEVTSKLKAHVAPGDVIIASEGLSQHLDFIGSWRLVDASILRPTPPGRPMGPASVAQRGPRMQKPHLASYHGLSEAELLAAWAQDVWKWAGPRRNVYWLVKESELRKHQERLREAVGGKTIAVIALPVGRAEPRGGFEPPPGRPEETRGPHPKPEFGRAPAPGPNQVFDLTFDGRPLLLYQLMPR